MTILCFDETSYVVQSRFTAEDMLLQTRTVSMVSFAMLVVTSLQDILYKTSMLVNTTQ